MVNQLDTDVLIIGGGLAGALAAIKASEFGINVLLTDKGLLGKSGCSVSAAVVTLPDVFEPPDSYAQFVKDIMSGGASGISGAFLFLGDQEIYKQLAESGAELLADLEEMGVYFRRDAKGAVLKSPTNLDKQGNVKKQRSILCNKFGDTGLQIMWIFRNKLMADGKITVLEETLATNLLTKDGNVVGAMALDIKNGKLLAIRAKSTILATGSGGYVWRYCTNSRQVTGDGQVMAFREGAELMDIEIAYWHIADITCPEAWRRLQIYPVPLPITGETPRWYNSKGERFLVGVERGMPKDAQAIEVVKEIQKGNASLDGGYYASLSHIDAHHLEEFYGNYSHLKKLGIDVARDLIECRMSVHSMQGGIRINERAETTLKGLYAIGSCAAAHYPRLHGCLWTGKVGAKYAALYANNIPIPELDWIQVEQEEKRVLNLLKTEPREGLSPAQFERRIRDIMMKNVHYIKSGEKLESALGELSEVRQTMAREMRLRSDTRNYNYGWVDSLDVLNMLDLAELVVKASLFRKESRGPFVREDYPTISSQACNTILKFEDGNIRIRSAPVRFLYVKPEDMHVLGDRKND